MNKSQIIELIDELLDGEIHEQDFKLLENELLNNPKARKIYYEALRFHNIMDIEADSRCEELKSLCLRPKFNIISKLRPWLVAAAFFSAIGLIWMLQQKPHLRHIEIAEEDSINDPEAIGYAVVSSISNAHFKTNTSLSMGGMVPNRAIHMVSGKLHLNMLSGVTIIMEGEVEFELSSPMDLHLQQGYLRAIVPEAAQGFKIHAKDGKIVDLGTEFSIDVNEERSEFKVYQGDIEWHPRDQQVNAVHEGQALAWQSQRGKLTPFDPSAEKSFSESLAEFKKTRERRHQNWSDHVKRYVNENEALVYYPFSPLSIEQRLVVNSARVGKDALLIASQSTEDRWGKSNSALNFKMPGSRVSVDIEGVFPSITMLCWVRINSLDRRQNSLFHVDDLPSYSPRWEIMDNGKIHFHFFRGDNKQGKYEARTASFWNPSRSGEWFQLAVVLNSALDTCTHYVNGRIWKHHKPGPGFKEGEGLRIGKASIGNWYKTRQGPNFPMLNLNGSIDDFMIFPKALSGKAIRALYRQGSP